MRWVVVACLLLLEFVPISLSAQTDAPHTRPVTITGRVIDSESGDVLGGAILDLPAVGHTTQSDNQGIFRFTNLSPRRYILVARRLGYIPDSTAFTLADSDTALLIRLRPSAFQLSSVDIASSSVERRGQSPSNTIEGEELDRQLSSSIAATIAAQPGVTQRYNGPMAAQPVIRGLTGDRVLVLEDGLRTGDIATTAPDHAVTIDPLTVQRIEVIRGPAGLLYGTNTLGGVVNAIREEIPRQRAERMNATFASQFESVNNSTTALGTFSLPLPFNISTRGELTGRRGGDTRTPSGDLPFTNFRSVDGAVGASWIGKSGMFGASVRTYHTYYGVPSSFNGITLPGSHTGGVYVDARRTTGRVEGEYSPSTTGLFRSISVQGNYIRFTQKELELGGFVGTRFGQLAASGDAVARYAHGRHSGAIGTFAQWRDFRAVGSYTGTRPAILNAHAIFWFHELALSPVQITAGVRYDRLHITPLDSSESALLPALRTRTFGSFTWTAGTTYTIAPPLSIGVNLARAFRAPAIEELFSAGPHLASYAYEIGNPSLRAEVGTGMDVVVRYTGTRVTGELSFFRNNIDNFIQYAPLIDSTTGLPIRDPRLRRYAVYQATQSNARLTGVEGSIDWKAYPSVTVSLGGSTLRGEQYDGEPLPSMPPARFRVGIQHDRPRWFIGGHVETTRTQHRVPSPPALTGSCTFSEGHEHTELLPAEFCATHGVTLLNTTAGLRFTTRGVLQTITVSVDNLLDTEWKDPLWRAKQVAPQPGRNIRLLYRVRFE